jgi:hypothetical protein
MIETEQRQCIDGRNAPLPYTSINLLRHHGARSLQKWRSACVSDEDLVRKHNFYFLFYFMFKSI